MSHSVAVVSVEQVTILCGDVGFQLKEVIGGRFDTCCLLFDVSDIAGQYPHLTAGFVGATSTRLRFRCSHS